MALLAATLAALLGRLAATAVAAAAGAAGVECPAGVPRRGQATRILYGLLFRDEYDVLAVLMAELFDIVDLFVIVGADRTFSGSKKPNYLNSEYMRYTGQAFKLHHIEIALPGYCAEHLGQCLQHLRGTMAQVAVERLGQEQRLQGDDLLIIADADEILSADTVLQLKYCRFEAPILFRLQHFVYSAEWTIPDNGRLPRHKACSGTGTVAVTLDDLLLTGGIYGSCGAVRSSEWRISGPGRNATCIAGKVGRRRTAVGDCAWEAPAGWHFALHGGWRQVQRALLSSGDSRLEKYASRQAIFHMMRHGLVPRELGWGPRASRCSWPGGRSPRGLPRGLTPGEAMLPWARCWTDASVENSDACLQLAPLALAGGTASRRPAAPPAAAPPAAPPPLPARALSDAECWGEVDISPQLQIEDWPTPELCCLLGGLRQCWRPEQGRTFTTCCRNRPGRGCPAFTGEVCWQLRREPGMLDKVVQLAYILEPKGAYSHPRLLARILMAIAVGEGKITGRPDAGSAGGGFPGVSVVEVGVHEGLFAEAFLETLEMLTLPVRQYTLVDRWAEMPSSLYDEQGEGTDIEHASRLAKATARLAKRWPSKVRFLQVESATAARWLSNDGEKADLVFIDARHDYDSVWDDLQAWWPVVREGGLFAGDDYEIARSDVVGVKRAVDEFAWALGLSEQLVAPIRRCWLLPKAEDSPAPQRPAWLRLS